MDFIIRKCMISDAEAIRSICRSQLGYELPQDEFEANLRKLIGLRDHRVLVAEIRGKVVGFIHACDFNVLYAKPTKLMSAIAVDPEYHRSGAATQLLEAIESWAKESGVTGIRIYGGSERKISHEFYKSMGYSFIKSEVLYRKEL